jgi:hypothetical protein
MVRRARLGAIFAWGALAASLLFAALAAERWRERVLETTVAAIESLRRDADDALAARERFQALAAESAQVTALAADGGEPAQVLGVLAKRLPRDASLTAVRADSSGWEVTGSARDALAVLRALSADSALRDVHAVGGTNRVPGARGVEESFVIAFQLRGAHAAK